MRIAARRFIRKFNFNYTKTIKFDLHKITIIFRNSFSYREVNKVETPIHISSTSTVIILCTVFFLSSTG